MTQEPKEQESLYTILGVAPTATQDELHKAYRKKALQLHPDRNQEDPDATAKFQAVNQAYEILKDPQRRESYDKFGLNPSGEAPTQPKDVEVFEMMTQVFGLGRSRKPPTGPKVSPSFRFLTVPLETVYTGGPVETTIKINTVCPTCHGTGSNNGTEYPPCPQCEGAGSLSPGGLQFLFPCKTCHSVGYIIPPECICKTCKGHKVISTKKTIKTSVEMGVNEQDQITLPNEGDEYPGKESADLMLIVTMKSHSDFIRDGDDLIFVKKLSYAELANGTAFTIKCLSGNVYNVHTEKDKNVDCSKVKWIRNEGMPCKGNVQFRGNLFIVFKKGFPEVILESVRMISSWVKMKSADVLLEDAPEEIQERFRDDGSSHSAEGAN